MSLLDEIKLPGSSNKEELEQLSKDKLRPLFDLKLFEVREETYRDKGLDLLIELKHNNKYTNFRFLVQLKSTETKEPNKDGSYSWQIDTSNIQYLLNGGLPAYYICFVKQTNSFYYRQLNDFVSELTNKSKDWSNQESNILRTSDILGHDAIMKIFEEVKQKCIATRELTEKLQIGKKENQTRKVSITSEYKVTDESSIVELVEKIGLTIINEGKSKDVILLNEKVSNDIASPLYNLTVGIAAYYTSNLFDALSFFQKASRQKKDLPKQLIEHLTYFDALVKYSIGFINKKDYIQIIDSLKESEHLQFYIRIEQAKEKYINNFNDDGFQDFRKEIFEITENKDVSLNIKFIASCEYLLLWGYKINMEHFQSIALINALESENGPNKQLRIQSARDWYNQNLEWEKFNQKLSSEIVDKKDFFAFNMCKLTEVKVKFELIVYTSLITFEQQIPDFPSYIHDETSSQIDTILKNLETICSNYKSLYHVENIIATLSTKYEVLKFSKRFEEAKETINEINELIEFHDLKEQKRKLEFLLNGGTTEEKIIHLIDNTVKKSKSDREEWNTLVDEMKALDNLEEKQNAKPENASITIELFPIGHFSVPKKKLDRFYELLEIDSYKLTKHLDYFFENGIIPVLNIFNKIEQEGYCNGKFDDKGIESWRKIRDIRKGMFNEKFVRVIIR